MTRLGPHMIDDRRWKIDGYPVSEREILEQATMIRGNTVRSLGLALRILRNEGREVTEEGNSDEGL